MKQSWNQYGPTVYNCGDQVKNKHQRDITLPIQCIATMIYQDTNMHTVAEEITNTSNKITKKILKIIQPSSS